MRFRWYEDAIYQLQWSLCAVKFVREGAF